MVHVFPGAVERHALRVQPLSMVPVVSQTVCRNSSLSWSPSTTSLSLRVVRFPKESDLVNMPAQHSRLERRHRRAGLIWTSSLAVSRPK